MSEARLEQNDSVNSTTALQASNELYRLRVFERAFNRLGAILKSQAPGYFDRQCEILKQELRRQE